jgi:predicted nucleotidyltransferase
MNRLTGAVDLQYDPAGLETVCDRLGLRPVVLFGSRSTGSPPPTPESDLDVAIRVHPGEAERSLWAYYQELSEVFGGYSLDLVLLNDADPLLRHEVMEGGTLLHGDPDHFLEYRAYAYRDFVDSADLRALEGSLFQKKMAYLRGELDAPS